MDDFYQYMKSNKPDITKIAVFDAEGRLADFSKVIGDQIAEWRLAAASTF